MKAVIKSMENIMNTLQEPKMITKIIEIELYDLPCTIEGHTRLVETLKEGKRAVNTKLKG